MDETRSLVVDDGPIVAATPGAPPCLGTRIQVLAGIVQPSRLTAPMVAAQDAEKTAVFYYSKEKYGVRALGPNGDAPGLLLHYNVTFPFQFGGGDNRPGTRFVSASKNGTV
jgi:hypothetical protein